MKKTVYLFDETGRYVGPYDAQESPLEPGVFIVPVSATEVSPPAVSADQYPKRDGARWVVVDVPPPPPEPPNPVGIINYNALIRRRAERLVAQGKQYDALLLLKTIGA